ncbi:hypothetical protein EWE75_13580 [Sphingomonas populi]|uniref:Twin-arginine translocation pathway signal n=1 Tax=Sphingomonas populi TaxID=2484750 RepID=A0A4Q6Y1D4_9SPHN|nr:hypothetical protein [Sphingomonas populi]RZF64002.1 hypothetical protein EWE75_13580 [Sphingomonas populi]
MIGATTRRAMLGAIAGVSVVALAGAALANHSHASEWDAALSDYHQKKATAERMGATDEDGVDAAVDAYCMAMDHLVENVRAPTFAALTYKIELAKERWTDFPMPEEWLNAFAADIRKLAAIGATIGGVA